MLQHFLDTDEFLFLHDALGYESLLANSNAAQAILNLLSDFDSPDYKTLVGGMDCLPAMLAFEAQAEASGCLIAERHTATSITAVAGEDGKTYFNLEVTCTPLGAAVDSNGRDISKLPFPRTYKARNVILALPKAAMSSIEFNNFPVANQAQFVKNLGNVTARPAFKLFLRYSKPWWQKQFNALRARATTDLPIRQVYYMGNDDAPSMIMASYSDAHYVEFWAPLMDDPHRAAMIVKLKAPRIQHSLDVSSYAASERITHKAEEQLGRMHEGIDIPPAERGVVKEWKQAWHFWNVRTEPWKVAKEMVRPLGPDYNVFSCGEAYSLEQGWVEGALKSAERVLKDIPLEKQLSKPDWISDKAYEKDARCDGYEQYISH